MQESSTLILGIGNDILTDDGIGPKLCDSLRDEWKDENLRFEKLNVGGMEVLEFIQEYKRVIFIDAIKTWNGKIGDVYYFTPGNFKETLHLSNLHDVNFITALELGKKLGFQVPEEMHIIAVEIKEDMVFSEDFSEELSCKYWDIKQKVSDIIKELTDFKPSKPLKRSEYIQ